MFEAPDIPGAARVIAWFGYWPTFHDAEVLSISLDRSRGCQVAIHAFHSGAICTKHAVVTFFMEGFPQDADGITKVQIEGFNCQNVLASASVTRTPLGYELEWKTAMAWVRRSFASV